LIESQLASLGLTVQTVSAALLALIFLYLSRGKGNLVLQAAGTAWVFLFLARASQIILERSGVPGVDVIFEYLSLLYAVALCLAAIRMDRQVSLWKPLAVTAVAALPVSLFLGIQVGHARFAAFNAGLLGVAWLLVAVFVFQSPAAGLGRGFAGLLALVSSGAQIAYVVVFVISTGSRSPGQQVANLYGPFLDALLQMLFGIGLIIWAMEDTERRLAALHARTVDDTRRSQRKAWLDPLTETHNRFFLDEIRPELEADDLGGSIVLIDIDGLKRINDQEGHAEGDNAIWTVATAIKKLIRGNDHVIRWGGDEFLVILPGMDEELARRRFYMLPSKIEEAKQSTRPGSRPYARFLAASVGVHPYSKRIPLDVAITQADRVMYERKRAHREMRGPLRGGTQ
jgi:diguanylate cyclase (GGDEF)-like protein